MLRRNGETSNPQSIEINVILGNPGENGFKIRIQRCSDDMCVAQSETKKLVMAVSSLLK